jgi:hypothetical protein
LTTQVPPGVAGRSTSAHTKFPRRLARLPRGVDRIDDGTSASFSGDDCYERENRGGVVDLESQRVAIPGVQPAAGVGVTDDVGIRLGDGEVDIAGVGLTRFAGRVDYAARASVWCWILMVDSYPAGVM